MLIIMGCLKCLSIVIHVYIYETKNITDQILKFGIKTAAHALNHHALKDQT